MTLGESPAVPPEERRGVRPPSPVEGLLLLCLCALLFWGGALLLMGREGVLGYAILPAAAFLLPSVAWAEIRGAVKAAFPSRRPAARDLAASALLLAGASLLALALAGVLSGAPGSSGEEEALRNLVLGVPAPVRWLLFALVPALCEETLFRGVLLACLRRWGKWRAVIASALVFALFHGSPVRFGPVALLGVALALVVWDTGNLWLAVAGHAAHNGLILFALSHGKGEGPPPAAALASLALVGAGLVSLWLVLRKSPPQGNVETRKDGGAGPPSGEETAGAEEG